MAPEFKHVGESYTYKIDLWSLAVMMYQLVTYNWPLGYRDKKCTINCDYKIDILFVDSYWNDYSELRNVLQHLLIYDEYDRWGWPQLFRNEYIQQLLLRKQLRMMREENPSKYITEQDAQIILDEENEMRSFNGLFNFAYKKTI